MDSANCEPVNPFHPRNEAEVNTIRGVMMQKQETMKYIECEIEQLLEKKKRIEEDLVCLRVVLAPHNHNRLPNEVLSRTFVLVAQDYGPVHFPIPNDDPPPQLAILHVCSHWRRVALHTPELWSNTQFTYPTYLDQAIYLRHWRRWLLRAGNFPVTLSIDFYKSMPGHDDPFNFNLVQKFLLPFQVKRLHLVITIKNFEELSKLPENILSDLIVDLDLDLILRGAGANIDTPHPFFSRLRSVAFHCHNFDVWLDRLSQLGLPWSQLRSLDFSHTFSQADLHPLINILHQIPMLQVLALKISEFQIGSLEALLMPSLRDFTLMVNSESETEGMIDIDEILLNFTCPSLTKFKLAAYNFWTFKSFEILQRQYNMQGLHEIDFTRFPLPISSILQNAPALRVLSIEHDAILDDAAIIGISRGTLGRFLMELDLCVACDIDEVVGMVETRMKTVNQMFENGCSWKDEIAILRDVMVRGDGKSVCQERIDALEKLGINFTIQ
ncbi:hypothetical protein F5887DRAFT_1277547 [Amanita rubescens]|nr:hypothetical protein F5887DRAFT_1277547 [Amanita rubescens]